MFKSQSTENADPTKALGAQKTTAVVAKPVLTRTGSSRTALGDISNRGKPTVDESSKDIAVKKKASTVVLPPPSTASATTSTAALIPTFPAKRPKVEGKESPSAMVVDKRASLDPPLPMETSSSTSSKSTSSSSSSTSSSTNSKPTASGVLKEHQKLDAELQLTSGSLELDGADEVMDTSLDDIVENLTLSEVDAGDKDDPQMVTDYIQDILHYFRKTEARRAPSPTYMSKQTDVNAKMREILVDWLVEVHLKFKLCLETLYLTVNILDRFLERRAVKRTKLQLVGCTAMLIASKYEEIYAPEVKDFVYISDKAYTHEQILAMESIMLNTLKFNLTVPSPLRFAERYAKVGGGSKALQYTTEYLLELTLQKYNFLKYLPSLIAASCVYLAQKMTKEGSWNSKMVAVTQYTESALEPCVRDLIAVASQKNGRYCAVRKKFSNPKYGAVANTKVWTPESS